ncbi:MPT63 family protein [Mycolicibacterium houstonense]|uniref:MPT63 family protein n=1 Tax=Mycolicibacterium houstonense TaxID=146021 RepID=UPI0021F2B0FC|nr:MPT63 family protein [Mycolicibacterium houstonense]
MINMLTTPFAIAGAAALALAAAPQAAAETAYPATAEVGSTQELVDASGGVVTGWTIEEFEPADDALPGYQPVGQLWEADATVKAIKGSVTPIISNFNLRAANGQTYRVIFTVPAAEGVNPSTLTEGQSAEGELYFDVTGAAPDSVVYNAGGRDLLIWKGSPASQD